MGHKSKLVHLHFPANPLAGQQSQAANDYEDVISEFPDFAGPAGKDATCAEQAN